MSGTTCSSIPWDENEREDIRKEFEDAKDRELLMEILVRLSLIQETLDEIQEDECYDENY